MTDMYRPPQASSAPSPSVWGDLAAVLLATLFAATTHNIFALLYDYNISASYPEFVRRTLSFVSTKSSWVIAGLYLGFRVRVERAWTLLIVLVVGLFLSTLIFCLVVLRESLLMSLYASAITIRDVRYGWWEMFLYVVCLFGAFSVSSAYKEWRRSNHSLQGRRR